MDVFSGTQQRRLPQASNVTVRRSCPTERRQTCLDFMACHQLGSSSAQLPNGLFLVTSRPGVYEASRLSQIAFCHQIAQEAANARDYPSESHVIAQLGGRTSKLAAHSTSLHNLCRRSSASQCLHTTCQSRKPPFLLIVRLTMQISRARLPHQMHILRQGPGDQ
jgi:hypothetical protein